MNRWLASSAPALLAALLIGALVSAGPSINALNRVMRTGDTMTGTLTMSTGTSTGVTISGTGVGVTSAAASGTNGFACTTDGCRFDFGAGASDYASSDATTVTFAGPLTTAGAFSATTGGFSGLVSRTGTAAGFTAATASGTNAYAVTVDGARYDFGTGASDYASSDATTVTFAGPLTTSGAFAATTGGFSGLVSRTGTAAGFTAATASGTNAYAVTVNGARYDFGDGASDYASGDGTTVTFAGPVAVTGALSATTTITATTDINLAGNDITGTGTGQTLNIVSALAAATASSTVAAITLSPSATLDANDLVLEVNSVLAGTSLFTVDLEADVTWSGGTFAATTTTATALYTSATADSVTSTAVAAMTFQGTATLTSGDLTFEFNNAAGNQVFGITEAGTATASTVIASTLLRATQHNPVTTGVALYFAGEQTAAAASTTVAAFRFHAATALDATDLHTVWHASDGTTKLAELNYSGAFLASLSIGAGTNMNFSGTAPTISSGFGTSPSVTAGTATSFRVNVGTGGTANSGVVGLPTAATGWNCDCADLTTQSSTVFYCKQTASATTTATIGNFDAAGAAAAWVASDILAVRCTAL